MPKRIQRKRTKGWKMPENTVSITRPGKWGNPFQAIKHPFLHDGMFRVVTRGNYGDRCEEIIISYPLSYPSYNEALAASLSMYNDYVKTLPTNVLRGKDLACFCKEGDPCHGDILLKHANP